MKINAQPVKMAQLFLNHVKKDLVKIKTKETLVLETYSNGREQGYHLSVVLMPHLAWGCSFSEDRMSDQLVVYVGIGPSKFAVDPAFAAQGNAPDARGYHGARRYSSNPLGFQQASAYVTSSLRDFLSEENPA